MTTPINSSMTLEHFMWHSKVLFLRALTSFVQCITTCLIIILQKCYETYLSKKYLNASMTMQALSKNAKHIWITAKENKYNKYVFHFPKLHIIVHKMVLHFLDSDLNFKIYSSFTRSYLFLWYRKREGTNHLPFISYRMFWYGNKRWRS